MDRAKLMLIVVVLLVVLANQSSADIICVSTSDELQNALTTAIGNSQDDIIKVQQNTYNGNFVYTSTES